LALQKGFVDCPQRARKVHQQATPRLGGAAILLSFLTVLCLAGFSVPQVREMMWGDNPFIGCILIGSLGIFAIGFLDDLARLAPKTKLVGEFLFGENLKIIDQCGLKVRHNKLVVTYPFVPMHMASKGYWQINDEILSNKELMSFTQRGYEGSIEGKGKLVDL
jgi:UDP-N-acetylmuramyl pentapeptide phosphotransferase/UDP-N-acetylglucosamine-1-phosphate transferase